MTNEEKQKLVNQMYIDWETSCKEEGLTASEILELKNSVLEIFARMVEQKQNG